MATAAVQIPSHNRVEPGSSQLKPASYPDVAPPPETNINKVATDWVESLNNVLSSSDFNGISQIFLKEACWRDQLALTWNYHTLNGPEKITSFLKSSPKGSRISSVKVDYDNPKLAPHISAADYHGKVKGLAAFLTIETDVGRGRGVVRLLQDQDGKWKAFTLFTAMYELKGHEETIGANRPNGVDHGGQPGRKNWQERRTAMENFEGGLEPTVLILGTICSNECIFFTERECRCRTRRTHISCTASAIGSFRFDSRPLF